MQAEVLRPYFLLLLLLGAFVLTFSIFKPFLGPLAMAAIFAVVLQPVYRRLLTAYRGRAALAAISSIFVFIVLVLVPISFVASQIVAEASGLYVYFTAGDGIASLYGVGQQVSALISQFVPGVNINLEVLAANLDAYLTQGLEFIIGNLGGVLSGVSSFILSLFFFFIALYYLLKDGPALKKKIMELSPLRDVDEERVFGRLGLAVNSVVKGNLLIAAFQGVIATAGFTLFGLPNPVLWGTVAALSALVPAVGTSLVMVPAVLFLFATGTLTQAIGLGVWAVLAVGLIDNMLGPKLVGRGAQLHPLLILLSVLGGLALFGATGIFLGPLSVALLFALLTIHAESSRAS
ncbi:MAG: AI-2E family transporter [Candidatus Pacebacteria bacterium]|nr:AI-2E family transporter [Candidatus Paceibacterota bacterium]